MSEDKKYFAPEGRCDFCSMIYLRPHYWTRFCSDDCREKHKSRALDEQLAYIRKTNEGGEGE
jgi:hypothetical protein